MWSNELNIRDLAITLRDKGLWRQIGEIMGTDIKTKKIQFKSTGVDITRHVFEFWSFLIFPYTFLILTI